MIYRLQNPLTVENFLTLAHLANSRGEITLKKFIISAYYITVPGLEDYSRRH